MQFCRGTGLLRLQSQQWCNQPGPNFFILGEQQYFVWDAVSQITKCRHILNLWESTAPWTTPGYAYEFQRTISLLSVPVLAFLGTLLTIRYEINEKTRSTSSKICGCLVLQNLHYDCTFL